MNDKEDFSNYDESLPTVVILGDFIHEGLSAKIESLGFNAINKRFRSSPKNWKKIIELLHELNENGQLAIVFGYIPTPTLLLIAEEEYDDVRENLILELEKTKTIFFIYEDNLQGIVDPLPWEVNDEADLDINNRLYVLNARVDDKESETIHTHLDSFYKTNKAYTRTPTSEEWIHEHQALINRSLEILSDLTKKNLEILPFRKRSDVTIRIYEALDDVQSGVFLRLYVPHGRYQSEQFEDFITLFTRYLRDVEGKEFSVDFKRTSRGTTYIFIGRDDAASIEDLLKIGERFDSFLVLVQNDPNAAERVLSQRGSSSKDICFIIAKYARSSRRLALEIRHEYDRKRLLLTQQMEAELLDTQESSIIPIPIDNQPSALFNVVGNNAPVTINLATAAVAMHSKINVRDILSGGIQYTEEDQAIFELIAKLKDDLAAVQYRSDLERLKDPATSPDDRRTLGQKLKGFVYKMGKNIEHIGTEVLIAYLNSLVLGK